MTQGMFGLRKHSNRQYNRWR